ncbi:hypothetical protein [Flavobacterium caeni]|uniref:Uncharacterized protein n=1 Tax=Flavobacterium caeni TaxID=490189 RepID=A0A1G5JB66_9FLAO|nr:hypothetical protein [Flavobacterium caeni]SCY85487.1 hypothetical protein SAMN02927903_02607 [Flavobacterium caeni]
MKVRIKKNKFLFWGLFALNLAISVCAFALLPDRFFYDAKYITDKALHGKELIGSYAFTIAFYEKLGLSTMHFALVALIQYPILLLTLYKLGLPPNFHKFTVKNALIYLSFFMLAIFVSMPSKEFITFLFLAITPFIYQTRWNRNFKIVFSMVLFVAFGLFFRIYFILIPIIAVGMYLVSFIKFKNRVLAVFFYGILISFFLSMAHGVLKGQFLSQTSREHVNVDRRGKNVNSMIVSPVKTDVWYGEAVGILHGFVSVNLPIVEGARHILSPQIVAFTLWQLLMFYILIVRYLRCLRDRENKALELWCILFLFAYFIVQGVFEPDLGTAVRHKIGFLPLIYFVFYYDHIREKPQHNS